MLMNGGSLFKQQPGQVYKRHSFETQIRTVSFVLKISENATLGNEPQSSTGGGKKKYFLVANRCIFELILVPLTLHYEK